MHRIQFSQRSQIVWFKRIAMMLRAGISLGEILRMMIEVEDSQSARTIMIKIQSDVLNGLSLSRALQQFPDIFGRLTINLIRIGEESGSLEQSLLYVSEELKKRNELRNTVIAALMYPLIIIIATVGISLFLAVYLFPKLTPIFRSVHTTLPLSTRIVMSISTFLIHDWYVVPVVLGSLSIVGMYMKRIPLIRMLAEKVGMNIPVFGGLLQSYELSLAARTARALLVSGIHASDMLRIVSTTCSRRHYSHVFSVVAEQVEGGSTITAALAGYTHVFPSLFVHIVHSGELTGRLPESFVYISEHYEQEVKDMTKNLTTLIEPLLMLVMGTIVGFIALSIITPIYQLTSSISGN